MSSVVIDLKSARTCLSSKAGVWPSWATCLGPADRGGRIQDDAVIHLLVVEEVPQRGQVLFLRGGRERMTGLVDQVMFEVVADQEGRDLPEFDPALLAEPEEPVDGAFVGLPGIGVGDLRLEEIGIGVLGVGTGILDNLGRGDGATEPLQVGVDDQLMPIALRPAHGLDNLDLALRLVHDTPLLRFRSCRIMSFIRHGRKAKLRAGARSTSVPMPSHRPGRRRGQVDLQESPARRHPLPPADLRERRQGV